MFLLPGMEELDFFAQPRAIQDRFLESARGLTPPTLLAYAPLRDRVWLVLAVLSGLAFLLALAFAAIGYGDLNSHFALFSPWMAGVEALLFGACAVLATAATQRSRLTARLPFRRGIYLFPGALIMARGRRLRVLPLDELESVQAAGTRLALSFPGRKFEIRVETDESARRSSELALQHRQIVAHAKSAGDVHTLAGINPLIDSGIVSPFGSTVPFPAPSVGARLPVLVAAVGLGAAAGVGVWYVRNRLSEAALFEKAERKNTIAAYHQYLSRGGKRPEVQRLLLPRAELARARQAGTTAAIEHFIHDHPGSPVLGEARAALKAVMVARIAKLSRDKRLDGLRALQHDRLAGLVKVELRRAIAGYYQRELSRYTQHAGSARAAGRRCIQDLLQYASKHGPEVSVRFRAEASNLELADLAVKQSPYFPGTIAVPSQYFDDKNELRRSRAAAQALVRGLQQTFARDVLDFQLGPPISAGQDLDTNSLKTPALLLEYATRLSGTYANASPPVVLVGLALSLKAHCALPSAQPFEVLRQASWNSPPSDILKSGDPPDKIYDGMVEHKETDFNKSLLKALGLPPLTASSGAQ